MRPALFGAIFGLVSVCAVQPAAASPISTPVLGISAAGDAIAKAPDGSMWLTEPSSPGRVAKVAADGTVTEYLGGTAFAANAAPSGMAITADGSAWFISHASTSDELDRVSLATGTISPYYVKTAAPISLTTGPDGKLWLTANADSGAADFVARYTPIDGTPNGTTTIFSTGFTANSEPRSLITGADGALYFVEGNSTGRVGRITTDGAVTYSDVGGAPAALATGDNSTLWFSRGATVGLIGTTAPTLFASSGNPTALALGPDGAMWAASTGGVVRVAPDGTTQAIAAGIDPSAVGTGIAAGADGRMWLTLDRFPNLVRITVPPRVATPTATASSTTTAAITADVRPNGLATTAAVQLKSSTGAWVTLSEVPVGDGLDAAPVRFELAGLVSGATNALRVVATNAAGATTSVQAEVKLAAEATATPDPTTPAPTTPEATTPAATTPAATTPPAGQTTPAPAPAPTATPAPVQGLSVVVRPVRGTVTYKVPGSSTVREIDGAASIPNSSIIDTTQGTVSLASTVDGKTQLGSFYGGEFKVKQVKTTGMTQLYLSGKLDCAATTSGTASRYAAAKKRRHVWGKDDHGKFQTHGQDSVATVRGTEWLTTDTCAGTVVKVFKGAVSVAPRKGKGKAVTVKAGGRVFTPHGS